MYGLPNFNDFYQKPLIRIGENDRVRIFPNIHNSEIKDNELNTHWLIALEGCEKDRKSQIFHWKVVMFPSDQHGSFNFTAPLYVSPFFDFNEAVEFAKKLENMAKGDQFFQSVKAN